MDKTVSVIIPCFNDGIFLREAVASLDACDPELYEVIIVNDGSTDDETIEILRGFSSRHTVIDQPNAGLGTARNAGISASKGKYVLPLDSDDKLFPNLMSRGIEILDQRSEVGVVYGKRRLFGDGDASGFPQPSPFDRDRMVVGNYIGVCALIRKEALVDCGLFASDMPVQGHEDWDLWLTMIEKGWGFHFLDEVTYACRVRAHSMTSDMSRPENSIKTKEYIARKHAALIFDVLRSQYLELRRRRSPIPYFAWQVRDRLRQPQND